jgi:hypothetical protein
MDNITMRHPPSYGTIVLSLILLAIVCALLAGCQVTRYSDGETKLISISVMHKRIIKSVDMPGKLTIEGVASAGDPDTVEAVTKGVINGLKASQTGGAF